MGGASSLLLERSRKEVVAEEGGKGMVKARGGERERAARPRPRRSSRRRADGTGEEGDAGREEGQDRDCDTRQGL